MAGIQQVTRDLLSGLDLNRGSKEPELQKFWNDVFRVMECPVCLEIALPPIIQCKNGHFVCGVCREGVKKCVICREDYTSSRNYALESIVSEIEVKCNHKSCPEIQTIAKLREHLENCDYRPVECNNSSNTVCKNKLIDFDQYVTHLTELHKASLFAPGEPFIVYNSVSKEQAKLLIEQRNIPGKWPNSLHVHNGVTFILNMELEASAVLMWVTAMLTKAESKNYFADFQIGEMDRNGKIDSRSRNIKWTVGVCPVHSSLSDIKNSETADYVTFPVHRLISVSSREESDDFRFFFELKLRKVSTGKGTVVL